MQDCVFCKIVSGEIGSQKRYEDGEVLAFDDIHPVEPVHVILIPKKHMRDLSEANETIAGQLQMVMAKLAGELKILDGYKIELNAGRYQEVPHLHYHLKGG